MCRCYPHYHSLPHARVSSEKRLPQDARYRFTMNATCGSGHHVDDVGKSLRPEDRTPDSISNARRVESTETVSARPRPKSQSPHLAAQPRSLRVFQGFAMLCALLHPGQRPRPCHKAGRQQEALAACAETSPAASDIV